ncbi:MAG: hypothetical protein R2818_04265 [Flavobacteriales bacterium]
MRHPILLLTLLLATGLSAQHRPDARTLITLVHADLTKAGFSAEDLAAVVVKDHTATEH